MATVSITVPAALVPRLVACRALFPQYAALTDVQAFQQITADYWRNVLAGYEAGKAAETARTAALATATADGAGIQ